MSNKIENVMSKSVRRAAGIFLVTLLACSSAVAAPKGGTGGGDGGASAQPEYFRMQYRCPTTSGLDKDMIQVGEGVPEGKGFVVKHILGTLVMDSSVEFKHAMLMFEESEMYGGYLAGITAMQNGNAKYMVHFDRNVEFFMRQTPKPVVRTHPSFPLNPNGVLCHLTLHGFLVDL
jgi:hypothetical protein